MNDWLNPDEAPPSAAPDEGVPRAAHEADVLARLGAWVFGLVPPELAATPEYQRYTALLPKMLAGTLDHTSDDARWFQTYLAACLPCAAEYADLTAALAAERATWAAETPPAASPIRPRHRRGHLHHRRPKGED